MVVVPHQTQTTITVAAIQEKIRKKTRTIRLMTPKHETGFSYGDLESILRLYYINKFYIAKKIISKMHVFINKFFPGI